MADGAGLAGRAAAGHRDVDVELLHRLRRLERLLDDHLEDVVGEVVVDGALVDGDGTGARHEPDARHRGLPPSGRLVLDFDCQDSSELPCGLGGRDLQRPRLLRLVRVLVPAVNLQLLQLLAAELRLGEHPAHRVLDQPFGVLGLPVARRNRLEAARKSRVAAIDLDVELGARELDLLGVGDHDEVAHVEVRNVVRPVLAGEDPRDPARQATEHLPGSVDHEPVVANVGSLYRRCARSHLQTPNSRTLKVGRAEAGPGGTPVFEGG